MTAERQRLQGEIDKLNQALLDLTGERDALAKAEALAKKRIDTFRDMLGKFKAMIESGKIKIRIADNKMLVEMASAILFPSGKARLSEEGKEALTEVAGILATIEERNFQVAGHTDNVPIRNRRFKDNWDLSTARAVAVVRHLVENGMPRENLSAAGYADIQPVASNETEDGRAKNRRIEIVLVPNLNELPDLSALEKMIDE
ncbi:MAG: OmpA family protein [Polyangia bacterium]